MGLLHYLDTYKVCVIYSGLQALKGVPISILSGPITSEPICAV